jgi:hypothetical protein
MSFTLAFSSLLAYSHWDIHHYAPGSVIHQSALLIYAVLIRYAAIELFHCHIYAIVLLLPLFSYNIIIITSASVTPLRHIEIHAIEATAGYAISYFLRCCALHY